MVTLDEPSIAPESNDQELPLWLQQLIASSEAFPGLTSRISLWLPTLIAAWQAGLRGVALSNALRAQLHSGEPFIWPDELTASFIATLGDIIDTMPAMEDVIPMAADLITMSGEYIDDSKARTLLLGALTSVENLGQRLARALLETAFFSPAHPNPEHRARQLRRLFVQLEELFDRGLQIWVAPGLHTSNPGTPS